MTKKPWKHGANGIAWSLSPEKLDKKTKELIAVACTYMTRCPYCIEGHAKAAIAAGASKEELAEVIQIAMALSSGAAIAHRNFALDV